MRALCVLLLFLAASGARGQVMIVYGGPDCVETDHVRLLARGVAGPGGPDAVSTDGFGARLPEASGEMAGMRTASILDDAVLAWRTPVAGPGSHVACPRPQGMTEEWSTVRLSVEAGNETGDPGPLRYLDPTLPNVDKIGPDYEATVSVDRRVRVSARWRDFLPTDPAIAPRILDALDGRFPKRKGLALSAEGRLGSRVHVDAHALGAEDLPFEETLGREVPVRRQRLGGSVSTSWGPWYSSWYAGLDVRAERLDRPEWSALASGVGPDWREILSEAMVGRHLDLSPTRTLSLYGTLHQRQAEGPGLADGSVAWAEVDALLRGGYRSPEASARIAVGPSGLGGEASGEIPFAPRLDGTATLYVRRTLPEQHPGLPFWVARGYTGLASGETPLALEGVPVPMESAGGRISGRLWRDRMSDDWRTERSVMILASGSIESHRGETVLMPQFTLAPEAVAVSGPVRGVAASGAVAEAEASVRIGREEVVLDADPHVFSRVTGWARARLPLGGDAAFRAARDREPTLRIGAHAEHSPDGLLNLNARLEWRTATRWDGWPKPEVPAALLLDLGLARRLGVLDVSVTGRNVLGAPEQTHPLGATLDGRLFVRLDARF